MRHLRLPQPPAAPNGRAAPAIAELSIDDMRSGYEGGAFAVQDVAASVLSRIAALEPFLNAFIWINERMGEDAERLDAAFTAGGKRGPLHGIPVVLKDNMNVAGVRTTAGYAGFASDDRVVDPVAGAFNGVDLVPQRDATLVARLRKAGALIVGKSNLPDFALDGLRAELEPQRRYAEPLRIRSSRPALRAAAARRPSRLEWAWSASAPTPRARSCFRYRHKAWLGSSLASGLSPATESILVFRATTMSPVRSPRVSATRRSYLRSWWANAARNTRTVCARGRWRVGQSAFSS